MMTDEQRLSAARLLVIDEARRAWYSAELQDGLGWALRILDKLKSGEPLLGHEEYTLLMIHNQPPVDTPRN